MDIIQSWVDETDVRNYAMKLVAPSETISSEEDEDFVVVSPEEIFVKRENTKRDTIKDPQLADQAESVEKMVEALTNTSPVLSESKAQQNAVKALQNAARKANESGVLANRFGTVGGLDEERGWDKNARISDELRQHLGDSAGALVNREAVTDSLGALTQMLSNDWGAAQICISDRDGDIFVDSMQNAAWSRLTVTVTEPIRLLDIKQGAIGHGYMHLKLSARDLLQVVVTSTSHGLIIIGMIREKQLSSLEVWNLVNAVRTLV